MLVAHCQAFKKLLVNSLIECHFEYACYFWYPELIQFLRNTLFVLNLDPRSHFGPETSNVLLVQIYLDLLGGYLYKKELTTLY